MSNSETLNLRLLVANRSVSHNKGMNLLIAKLEMRSLGKALGMLVLAGVLWWCAEVLLVMNRVSDAVRSSPEYPAAKADYDKNGGSLWSDWTYRD